MVLILEGEGAPLDPTPFWKQEKQLGKGNFGVVYRTRHIRSDSVAAVKSMEMKEEDLEDIEYEIEVMNRCDCDQIVRYFGTFMKDNHLLVYMELCAGSVTDLMQQQGCGLSEPVVSFIVKESLLGLAYMHEHDMIHRDIKAANILLTSNARVLLSDFGVSAIIEPGSDGRRNSFVGSPYWMAPELIRCDNDRHATYNYKCDLWAMGITAVEMAELDPPWFEYHPLRVLYMIQNSNPPFFKKPEKVSSSFKKFVTTLLNKSAHKRPTANEALALPFCKNWERQRKGETLQDVINDILLHHAKKKDLNFFKMSYYDMDREALEPETETDTPQPSTPEPTDTQQQESKKVDEEIYPTPNDDDEVIAGEEGERDVPTSVGVAVDLNTLDWNKKSSISTTGGRGTGFGGANKGLKSSTSSLIHPRMPSTRRSQQNRQKRASLRSMNLNVLETIPGSTNTAPNVMPHNDIDDLDYSKPTHVELKSLTTKDLPFEILSGDVFAPKTYIFGTEKGLFSLDENGTISFLIQGSRFQKIFVLPQMNLVVALCGKIQPHIRVYTYKALETVFQVRKANPKAKLDKVKYFKVKGCSGCIDISLLRSNDDEKVFLLTAFKKKVQLYLWAEQTSNFMLVTSLNVPEKVLQAEPLRAPDGEITQIGVLGSRIFMLNLEKSISRELQLQYGSASSSKPLSIVPCSDQDMMVVYWKNGYLVDTDTLLVSEDKYTWKAFPFFVTPLRRQKFLAFSSAGMDVFDRELCEIQQRVEIPSSSARFICQQAQDVLVYVKRADNDHFLYLARDMQGAG
eukprot:Lithocolla_globosa_v1_NODE_1198_length_2794_cov_4.698430.p1 type:complete len:795 gc:universal NODE_1198_length_2794_cov_4.698430:2612-228(-)